MTPSPKDFFLDDFNDNSRNTERWELLQHNGATASETNQSLQVTVPSGSGWGQAGYVTKEHFALKEHILEVTIKNRGNLNEMTLQICRTKTYSDPYNEENWYRIQKTGDSSYRIQRSIDGSVETLYTFTSSAEKLVIKIQNGIIYLSDNYNMYWEPYAFTSYDCYVYVFASSQRDSAYGTGAFDDFAISPIILHLNDGVYDYNCYSGSTPQGGRGITTWGPIDIPVLAAHGNNGDVSAPLPFTNTEPDCYDNKDFCNITYTIHTASDVSNDIEIAFTLWEWNSPNEEWIQIGDPSLHYHSRFSGDSRDVTETIDIAPIPGYNDTGKMAITFTNNSPVQVWIKGLQVVRGYAMKGLRSTK